MIGYKLNKTLPLLFILQNKKKRNPEGFRFQYYCKQKLKFIYKSYCKLTYIEQTFAVYTKIK